MVAVELELIVALVFVVLLLLFLSSLLAGKTKIQEPIFVINGFYTAMREKYTQASAELYYFCVEWDAKQLGWGDFRSKVLGVTDPKEAEAGSLRRMVLDSWEDLGLEECPNVGDNGLHGSASPFEAMAERLNWVKDTLEKDPFAKALSSNQIKKTMIQEWTKDPQVEVDGQKASLFDTLEDMDSEDCIRKALKLGGSKSKGPSYPKNECFMFIKPHAVTEKVIGLVKGKLEENGIRILKEGKLDGKTIDNDKLIDNHYYSIANKAALMKPRELNVPDAKLREFESTFELAWDRALRSNKVFNAVDGCARLGIDGASMDGAWAAAKKAKRLVKFGGGFYVGLVDPRDAA
jgi:nucleoside diphosphate kinase